MNGEEVNVVRNEENEGQGELGFTLPLIERCPY
jgi:hypothetical protein